jgi:hypothetical protein
MDVPFSYDEHAGTLSITGGSTGSVSTPWVLKVREDDLVQYSADVARINEISPSEGLKWFLRDLHENLMTREAELGPFTVANGHIESTHPRPPQGGSSEEESIDGDWRT